MTEQQGREGVREGEREGKEGSEKGKREQGERVLKIRSHNIQKKAVLNMVQRHMNEGVDILAVQEIAQWREVNWEVQLNTEEKSYWVGNGRRHGAGLALSQRVAQWCTGEVLTGGDRTVAVILWVPEVGEVLVGSVYGSKLGREQVEIETALAKWI